MLPEAKLDILLAHHASLEAELLEMVQELRNLRAEIAELRAELNSRSGG